MNIRDLFEAFIASLTALFEGIFTHADARDRKIAELEHTVQLQDQRIAALESAVAHGLTEARKSEIVPEPQKFTEEDDLPWETLAEPTEEDDLPPWEDAPTAIPVPPMPETGADTDGDIIVPAMPGTGADTDGDVTIPPMPETGGDDSIVIPSMPETGVDSGIAIPAMPETEDEPESLETDIVRFYKDKGGHNREVCPNWDMSVPDLIVTYLEGGWHWSLETRPTKAEAAALAQCDYNATKDSGRANSKANNVWTSLAKQKLFPPERWWQLAKAMHEAYRFEYGAWTKAGEPEPTAEPAPAVEPKPIAPAAPAVDKLWNPKAGVVYRDTIRGAATWTTCWGTLPNGLEMTNIAQAVLVMELEHLQFHNKAVEWCDRSGPRKTDMFRGEKVNDALAALHKWVRKNGSDEQKRLYKGCKARCDAFVLDALRIKYMTGKNAAMTAALLATGDRCIMSPGEQDKYGPEIKRIDEQLMLIRAELRAELGC